MALMLGSAPVDPDGPIAAPLLPNPVSAEAFPDEAPSVVHRYDPDHQKLVALSKCLQERENTSGFDETEIVTRWAPVVGPQEPRHPRRRPMGPYAARDFAEMMVRTVRHMTCRATSAPLATMQAILCFLRETR